MLDEIDTKILTILQENCRTTNAEIARRVGMAPSAILERIRKLEALGVVPGFVLGRQYLPLRMAYAAHQILKFARRGDGMTVVRAKFAALPMIWKSRRDATWHISS